MSRPFCQKTNLFLTLIAVICLFGCHQKDASPAQFQLLRKDATGLDFENVLKPTTEFNALTYMYFYNGGGVAAGDFNNDGLVDLYFTSNMGPNKLFLNEGNLKFKDVTEQAGVAGMGGWTSGVSVVDINNDGLLDIYVSQLGDFLTMKGRNQLYVCQEIKDGIPIFEDEAIPYGLDLVGFGTQAAFFDYDGDGDLDMFQLNHSVHANGTFGQKKTFQGTQHPLSGDKLMRNDGEKFTEVTMQSGINSSVIGYGLGLAIGDLNNDGWPDIYVGNDFHENDYLYINQQNGTFREILSEATMHTSQFSMGVDIGDVNNDGWSDIISLDMLPEDPYILKSSLGEDEYGIYQFKLSYGYHPQNARNTLQLNNGISDFGQKTIKGQTPASNVFFSDIGMFASVYATDWSWASLFVDFDNDGYKDLFVSNGIERRMNDIDYANFRTSDQSEEVRWKTNTSTLDDKDLAVVDKMPKIKLTNKFFQNSGNLTFEDIEKRIKNNLPTFSNGAIYADLDNDGDLDLVVNNLEDEPYIYKNLLQENATATSSSAVAAIRASNSFLSFIFKGQPGNIHGIGTKILIYRKNGERQVEEFHPVRGYQSSAHIPLHIGIGDPNAIDSVVVIWPDRSCNRVLDLKFNTLQTLAWRASLPIFDFNSLQKPAPPYAFGNATATTNLNFQHTENPFVEFNRERLIPHMVSSEGPALAIGDINGDGWDDVFFGSSKRKKSALFLQRPNGTFYENTPLTIQQDSLFEDVDACFVDIDNDGDLDLVIAAGGNEYRGKEEAMKQRAYLNDGKGNFTRADPFPSLFMTASCVLPADFNGDGLMDFFFGGRSIPWNYGLTPNSYLMLNKGNGVFEEVTQQIAPGLQDVGLVKNGVWADLDGDGDLDLLLAMEWEPLTVFLNNRGRFEKKVLETGKGWWNFVLAHDFDGDGDVDILAGNLGENAKFKPTPNEPVRMYVNDFDENGQVEQILTYYLKGREIPFANHAEMTKQLPNLKKKYLYAANFAKATVPELLGKEKLAKSVVREADHFKSTYFENTGNFTFKAHPLPDVLQFSTLNTAALHDFDGDGHMEVLLGGNFYDCNIEMGRYDANYGNVLTIGKDGKMKAFPMGDLIVKGQVRRIRPITIRGETFFVLARNNMATMVVQPIRPTQ
ncbi:MAG: VCBS repeat-containing protein [Saprospiraceae bacterium]|nr:VCBS repeat-containing protein [Saprospiraceae bacterium]